MSDFDSDEFARKEAEERAKKLGVPVVDLAKFKPEPSALAMITRALAVQHGVLPLKKQENVLFYACSDPGDLQANDALRLASRCTIKPVLGIREEISKAIERYYPQEISATLDSEAAKPQVPAETRFFYENIHQEQALAYLRGELDTEQAAFFEDALVHSQEMRDALESARALLDALDAAGQEETTRLVNTLIQQAIRDHASDIHIVPGTADLGLQAIGETSVYFRMDGHLVKIALFTGGQHRALLDGWKTLAGMNIAEQRMPQDGRATVRYEHKEFDLRVSVLPTVAGERLTARILDKSQPLPELSALGIDASTLQTVERMVTRPHGYVLLAGLTHSGKTTLAYALLRHIYGAGQSRPNILTLEDPVEHRIPGLSQTAVNRRAGLTYANALRGITRSDPDVVYVGETRDEETAQLSIELAVTGHLVLSQLNVSSAIQTVQRLRDMGAANHLIAGNLAGAIGLRLVRKVCPQCAAEYAPSSRDLARAGLSLVEDGPFQRGVGCAKCRFTGFRGRAGLFEAWEVDETMRVLIAERADGDTLWRESFGRHGGSLWDDAREKIRQGLITVEDAAWALYDYPHPRYATQTPRDRHGVLDLSEL